MQLSSLSRKVVATGLAASTLLWSAMLVAPSIASADVHSEGCLVLSGGIVWMITGGTRRGFTSAEVFQSYGYNFSEVQTASAEDVALPVGPIMIYADGTLVKGPSDPLVYLVAGGQKRPFTSGAVFTGLGYSFANIQQAPINTFSDLPVGANLDSTTIAHPAGTLVISNGAIWQMAANGRMGFSSAANFQGYGYMFSHVVAANSYDLASPNLGDVPDRPACTGGNNNNNNNNTGSVSVSLAPDSPVANTIVLGQSTADLAHFTFFGSGSVTQLVLQRLGVSNNALLSNVYLYNGSQRITDGSAVSTSGQITFNNSSGLFNAPATISVRSDIETSGAGGTAGQTVGVGFASGMSGSASITGTASGSLFTSASATLATANFAGTLNAPNTSTNVNAGSLNYTVWSDQLTISTNSVWLKDATFKMIGSANTDALGNYILYVDGNQVATASSLTNINGSNYVSFAPATPFSLTTGSHTLEVRADILKGSGRTVQFTLQNAADIMVTDSQFNLNTTPTVASSTFTALSAGQLSIQNGTVTVQTDPTFGSVTTVPGGATNVTLGKYNLTAYGEDVQVNSLAVTFTSTSGLTNGINNVTLFVNGGQVGSAQQLTGTVSGDTATFTLGSSLIVPAGTVVNVSVNADTIDHSNASISSGTIQTNLVQSGSTNLNNSQGRSSQNILSVPAVGTSVSGPALTVGTGAITVAVNPAYQNQTLNPNSTAQKIGSFVIQAGNNEGVRVSNLAVALTQTNGTTALTTTTSAGVYPAYTDISNVKVSINGGTPSTPQSSQAAFNFSANQTLNPNSTMTVDVWGDLGSTGAGEVFKATLLPSVTGVVSNSNLTPGSATAGQAMTLNSASLGTATASGGTALSSLVSTSAAGTAGPAAMFNFTTTSGSATINELKFDVTDAVPTAGGLANVVSAIAVNGGPTISVVHLTGTGPGTVSVASGGTTVTGVSTTFLSTFKVGDLITVVGGNGVSNTNIAVTAIASNTSMTTAAMTNLAAGVSYTYDEGYVADVAGLNISVPSSSASGVDISVVPTYNGVTASGNGGIATNTRAQLGLIFVKSQSGSSPTTTYYSGASGAPATLYSNPMVLVAGAPTIAATSTVLPTISGGLQDVLEFTITAPASGSVRIKQIGFTPNFTTAHLTNKASDTVQLYDPSNSSVILNNAQSVGGGGAASITLTTATQAAIILDTPLIVSAGSSRTLRIKVDQTGLTNAGDSFRLDLTNTSETYAAHNTAQANKWAWNDFTIADYLNGYLLKNLSVTGTQATHS